MILTKKKYTITVPEINTNAFFTYPNLLVRCNKTMEVIKISLDDMNLLW